MKPTMNYLHKYIIIYDSTINYYIEDPQSDTELIDCIKSNMESFIHNKVGVYLLLDINTGNYFSNITYAFDDTNYIFQEDLSNKINSIIDLYKDLI